jgi:GT2 family glycosyltransferase
VVGTESFARGRRLPIWDGGAVIFLMISTHNSQQFTAPSAASLIKKTPLRPDDKFVIVDNDGTLGEIAGACVIRNERRRSFAENANFGLALSAVLGDDVIILNNDIIYTENWLEHLNPDGRQILVPFCNQNAQYHCQNLKLEFVMDYADYHDRDDELEAIARHHREHSATLSPLVEDVLISFYCVYIPRGVSQILGHFDETFGRGGGEDVDYRLRALQAGIDVKLARFSYLLHFMGKSTWRSGEAAADSAFAYAVYQRRFIEKWGQPIADLFLAGPDKPSIAARYGVLAEFARGDFRATLKRLAEISAATISAEALPALSS